MQAKIEVWLAGPTGLVGRETLASLLEQPATHVLAVARRTSAVAHPRLEEKLVDFEQIERELHGRSGHAAICCLGTTIKQAGSREQFRHIDYDYVLAFARAARAASVPHFLVVTALGAAPGSRVFYNRVKGEVERALEALGFPALTIVRPSLLLGERAEWRAGERLLAPLSRLLPKRIGGIEASKVGRALARLAERPATGTRIVSSGELHELGAAL